MILIAKKDESNPKGELELDSLILVFKEILKETEDKFNLLINSKINELKEEFKKELKKELIIDLLNEIRSSNSFSIPNLNIINSNVIESDSKINVGNIYYDKLNDRVRIKLKNKWVTLISKEQ